MHNETAVDLALAVLLVAASVRDLTARRIPNRLLLAGLVAALVLHLGADAPLARLASAAAGFALGLVIFLPLYCLRGMAAGDVKLMATVGAFTGPALAFEIALASCVAGGVMALVIVVVKGHMRTVCTNLLALLRPAVLRMLGVPLVAEQLPRASVGTMPYGVAITLGSLAMLWIRHG